VKSETKIKCALEIAKNYFDEKKTWLTGIMHMKTHLLNGISNVGAG
jgi:hypothetical protein